MTRWVGWALLLAGCLEPGRASVEVPVVATPVVGSTWVDDDGRTFVLQEGHIGLTYLRMMEPSAASELALALPGPWWLPEVAVAHPGHDDAGPVGGELPGSWVIDLLAEPAELGVASLFEGDYDEAELDFLGSTLLSGTVDGRPFRFEVEPTQTLTAISFDATITTDPPTELVLAIDAAWALSFVDFDLPDTDGDGVLTEADDEVEELLLFGLHSNAGYALSLP